MNGPENILTKLGFSKLRSTLFDLTKLSLKNYSDNLILSIYIKNTFLLLAMIKN